MWRFATIIMCVAIKAALICCLFAVVAFHVNVLLLVVFAFLGLLGGCMLSYLTYKADAYSNPSARLLAIQPA